MTRNKLLLFVALLFVFYGLFLPRPHLASDLHHIFPEGLKENLSLPRTFSNYEVGDGLGERTLFTSWFWPVRLAFALLGKLGINFTYSMILVGFVPMLILAAVGMGRLLKYYKIGNWGEVGGIGLYLLNSYFLLLVDGGQINLAIAYSLLPWAFLYIDTATSKPSPKNFLNAFFPVLGISVFDPRIFLLLGTLILVRLLVKIFFEGLKMKNIYIYFQLACFISFLLIGFHLYWLLPAWFIKGGQIIPPTFERTSQLSFLSFANIGHPLLLEAPHWFKNVFGKITTLKPEFVLIPILAFLAPILVSAKKQKDRAKTVGFWLLVALIGVFLVKGTNPPLPNIYPWLFTHIPGFSLFRDPTKFFFLVALSYSVLIGITVDELSKRFKWKMAFGKWKIAFIPLLITIYYLLITHPVWLGQMTGTFSKPIYQEEYSELENIIKEDKDFGRVFWIPTKAPLGYSSPSHPSVEASRLAQKRPFAIGTVGTYEIFNYLREAPFMGELFKLAGIKYIAYPFPDTRREELKQDNLDYYHAFLDQLANLPWIDEKLSQPPVPVLKTKENTDHFFIAQNSFCLVGSDRIYWELMNLDNFSLANNAIVFMEEKPNLGAMVRDAPCTYLLFEKEITDLAASFIKKENFVFPAEKLDFDPEPAEGWWKREAADLIQWRAFLQEKYGIDNLDFDYGGGWAVSEADSSKLKVQSEKLRSGDILLARVMVSNGGGRIEFFQGEEKIGEIDTKVEEPEKVQIKLAGYEEIPEQVFEYDKADFSWFEVGKLAINYQPLVIRTEGDINVVNTLISVPENEWIEVKERIDELIHQDRVVDWGELSESERVTLFAGKDNASLTYKRISPTHYKVKIENVKEPVTLAFSETYDSLWELDGQSSYPLYSLINGFTTKQDGEYDVVFSAQKYVLPGLFISTAALASILLFFVLRTKKGRKI